MENTLYQVANVHMYYMIKEIVLWVFFGYRRWFQQHIAGRNIGAPGWAKR